MSYYSRGNRGGGYRGSGGFRGNRGGGESFRSRGGNRGSFSSSRGGSGNRYFSNPSSSTSPHYDSRPPRGGGAEKFSRSRNSGDYHNSGYKDETYGSRNDYRRASPEPPRKRGRPDSSPMYSSSRRSPDRFSSSDFHRSFDKSSSSGGGYLSEKGTYREVREAKPEYSFRKPGGTFATRGGRGLSMRGRSGLRSGRYRGSLGRGSFKTNNSILARRRLESLGVRKRYPPENMRKFSAYSRTKRFSSQRDRRKSDDEEEDDEIIDGEDDDEMAEEEVEEEEDMQEMGDEEDAGIEEDDESKIKEEDDGEEGVCDEEGAKDGDEQEDEDVHEAKEKKASDGDKGDGEEGDAQMKDVEASPKKKMIVKKAPVAKKKVALKKVKKAVKPKVKKEADVGNKEDDAEQKDDKDGEAEEVDDCKAARYKCPHCSYGCETTSEYSRHLAGKKHQQAMSNLSTKLRAKLNAMRIDQRINQKSLDDEARATNMKLRTFYCQICKLNFRTLKSEHFSSVAHKKMKEFLIPFCRLCKVPFKSPWAYENHISELTHMKRKASKKDFVEGVEKDVDVDPSDFMVLDAVGSGDEDEESDKSGDAEGKDQEPTKDGSSPKKTKKEINLGAEHCKLVEVHFCELCKIYLSRYESREQALASHCRSRTHLHRYIRYRDDQSLIRRAVKIHKELEKEKEEAGKKKGKETKKAENEDLEKPVISKKEDDKAWSEVDKDLSDLLHDEEGGQEAAQDEDAVLEEENGDEDEDSQQKSERYDRFKKSEKEKESAKAALIAANGSIAAEEKKKLDPEVGEK